MTISMSTMFFLIIMVSFGALVITTAILSIRCMLKYLNSKK